MTDALKTDGTDRLCRVLYGRGARPQDYLGGLDARMLHDAADRLEELKLLTVSEGEDAIFLEREYKGWIINLLENGIEVISPGRRKLKIKQLNSNTVKIEEDDARRPDAGQRRLRKCGRVDSAEDDMTPRLQTADGRNGA